MGYRRPGSDMVNESTEWDVNQPELMLAQPSVGGLTHIAERTAFMSKRSGIGTPSEWMLSLFCGNVLRVPMRSGLFADVIGFPSPREYPHVASVPDDIPLCHGCVMGYLRANLKESFRMGFAGGRKSKDGFYYRGYIDYPSYSKTRSAFELLARLSGRAWGRGTLWGTSSKT